MIRLKNLICISLVSSLTFLALFIVFVYKDDTRCEAADKAKVTNAVRFQGPLTVESKDEAPLLIYVFSRAQNHQSRKRIRDSYAGPEIKRYLNITVIFVIGEVPRQLKLIYEKEVSQFKDMVTFPVTETYRSLPQKAKLALPWLYENFGQHQFVLKTDDDIFLNIFEIVRYFRESVPLTDDRLHCMIIDDLRPGRRKGAAFYTTKEEFDGAIFPPYCVGHGVMFSRLVLQKLVEGYRATNSTMWVEDIFSFGIVRQELNLSMVDLKRRYVDGLCHEMLYTKSIWFSHLNRMNWVNHWNDMWQTLLLQYPDEVKPLAAISNSK